MGKHATGGMNLNGYPLAQDHGTALLGINASGSAGDYLGHGKPNGPSRPRRPRPRAIPRRLRRTDPRFGARTGAGGVSQAAFGAEHG